MALALKKKTHRRAPARRSTKPSAKLVPPVTHSAPGGAVQTQLEVAAPNDRFEQEADRVAEEVMRMPDSAVSGAPSGDTVSGGFAKPPAMNGLGMVQRLCAECAAEEEEKVQRKCSACDELQREAQPAFRETPPGRQYGHGSARAARSL